MENKLNRQYFVAAGRGMHTTIDTTALIDKKLSWKAKALHYYIRTQMEALTNQQELVDAGPDGKDAVGSGVKELIQHRYLYMRQKRDENGQFECVIYISFPEPVHINPNELSTLLSTGTVRMSPANVPMSPPQPENPETVRSGQDVIYYLTSLNKNISNNSLRSLSHNIAARPPGLHNPTEISQSMIMELFDLWNSQPALPNHKKNPKFKKYTSCVHALKRALGNHSPEVIKAAIMEYNTLLLSPHTVVGKKAPARVGLDEFFKFTSYTRSIVDGLDERSPMHGIQSWFEECKKGKVYTMNKYARVHKDKHPEVTQALRSEFEMATGWQPDTVTDGAWDTNHFATAAAKVINYLNKHRARLPHNYTPVWLAHDFVNMVSGLSNPHPGVLVSDKVWAMFDKYLLEIELFNNSQHTGGGVHGFKATASI